MNKPKSFRLSEKACSILARLAKRYGISQTAFLEVLLRDREKAEKEARGKGA